MSRKYEIGFWVLFYGFLDLVNATSVLIEYGRNDLPLEAWEPFVWEFSSGFMLVCLVPFVIGFDRYFSFSPATWKKSLVIHLLLTIPYSLVHVGGMVAIREIVYALMDRSYDFGNIPLELFYEYRKDLLDYAFVLIVLYIYRYIRARHMGESREMTGGAPGEDAPRFLVRHRERKIIVPASDIIWLEGAGNYVLFHTKDHSYAHRATMAEMTDKLIPFDFSRSHKSAIVNLKMVIGINPGQSKILLQDGKKAPLGRHYRNGFQARLSVAG